MSNSFGENIKKYRKENGLSQSDFADELSYHIQQRLQKTDFEYSNKNISKWERGESLPPLDVIIALSSLLAVNLDELLKSDIEKFSSGSQFAGDINSLSKNSKKLLYDLLQIDFQYDENTDTYYVLFDMCLRLNKNDATLICTFGNCLNDEKSFAWSRTEFENQAERLSATEIVESKLKEELFSELISAGTIKNVICSDSHNLDDSIDIRYNDATQLYITQIDLGMPSEEIVEFITSYIKEQTVARLDNANGSQPDNGVFEWHEDK